MRVLFHSYGSLLLTGLLRTLRYMSMTLIFPLLLFVGLGLSFLAPLMIMQSTGHIVLWFLFFMFIGILADETWMTWQEGKKDS